MDAAFEQVRQAEQDADMILSAAKEKIAVLKQETAERIKAMEDKYGSDLKSFQLNLQKNEDEEISHQLSMLEGKWNSDKKNIEESFASYKGELVLALAGKVINQYGNSRN
ncbi:MAG: hypothetical protein VB078_00800 [Clostridiaceae bacterium]|nr:hypothetical protein [Clostridiaceae bacterium]